MQDGGKRPVTCKCSFLEIHNGSLTDLLSPSDDQHPQDPVDPNNPSLCPGDCKMLVALQDGVKRTVTCKCSFLESTNGSLMDLLSASNGQHLQSPADPNNPFLYPGGCKRLFRCRTASSAQ